MHSAVQISVYGVLIALDCSSLCEDIEGETQWERCVWKALLITVVS